MTSDDTSERWEELDADPQEELDPWDLAVLREHELQKQKHKIGLLIQDLFRVETKVGFGTFGSIFSAVNVSSREKAAVKFEFDTGTAKKSHLFYEHKVYENLGRAEGIPRIYWFGSEFSYNILVMELLGPNLEQLLQYCDDSFSLKTVLMLADQMLDRLRHVHHCGYVHRDLKPANFLIGLAENTSKIYLIDYGLTKRFRYREGGVLKHVPFRNGRPLVGTARYASLNAHKGFELTRRDDLESLGYILAAFRLGSLPWQALQARTKKQRYNRIRNKKLDAVPDKLCQGLPREFRDYFNYCATLRFDEEPNYDYLQRMFRNLMRKRGFVYDGLFDWDFVSRRPQKRDAWDVLFKWTTEPKMEEAVDAPAENGSGSQRSSSTSQH